MVEQIIGEIQNFKIGRKALAINNIWYNSFKEIDSNLKKGDLVKIEYSIKNNFKNIKSIIKQEEVKQESNKVPISDIIASQILSYSKDIYIAGLNNDHEADFSNIVNKLLDNYKKIKS